MYRALGRHRIFRIDVQTKTFIKKILLASLIMGLLLVLVMPELRDWNTWNAPYRVGALAGLVLLGASCYFISLLLLRVKLRETLHWSNR